MAKGKKNANEQLLFQTPSLHLLVLQLLLFQEPLQILHVIVLEVLDEAARGLKTLLDGEAGGLVTARENDNTVLLRLAKTRRASASSRGSPSHSNRQ